MAQVLIAPHPPYRVVDIPLVPLVQVVDTCHLLNQAYPEMM